jgi:hypothetical protein
MVRPLNLLAAAIQAFDETVFAHIEWTVIAIAEAVTFEGLSLNEGKSGLLMNRPASPWTVSALTTLGVRCSNCV